MPVEMTPVQSSHVWHIGHDPETETLFVRFKPSVKHPAGRLVQYLGVDADTAQRVTTAPSVGQALHSFIKGVFEMRG